MRSVTIALVMAFCAALGYGAGTIVTENYPTGVAKLNSICEYEGGEMHDKLCIVNGRVFPIDIGD